MPTEPQSFINLPRNVTKQKLYYEMEKRNIINSIINIISIRRFLFKSNVPFLHIMSIPRYHKIFAKCWFNIILNSTHWINWIQQKFTYVQFFLNLREVYLCKEIFVVGINHKNASDYEIWFWNKSLTTLN